jgi:spore germination protein GerM
MQDHQPIHDSQPTPEPSRRSARWGIVAGLSAILILAGGGGAWWAWRMSSTPTPSTPIAEQPVQQPTETVPSETSQVPTEQTVQVYWLRSTDTSFELVPASVSVNATDEPQDTLQAAFEQLLQGPSSAEVASTIPDGTELRNLEIRADGIHVDLSDEFNQGGGSAAMSGRLGQVIYTATSLDPTAEVWISVEGEPLETLGGEGLIVDQPMTRTDFDQNFAL